MSEPRTGRDDDVAVSVKGLYKDFKLPHERSNSLKERLLHLNKTTTYDHLHALKDINFEIKRGEFFGIVGRNGSGKSTLLKIIGGIYQPTKGKVEVNGTLTPFIELGIGFNPELTGRENVYLNGAILGLTRKEIVEKYDEIVEFQELEKFMDQKLKNYSSGMQVRLAFSIAMQAHNDILLIDEVLAVGDANFQRKCYRVFNEIKKSGKTVIFVTHGMAAVQEFCDRALMIEDSKLLMIGKPREVALHYEVANAEQDQVLGKSARPKDPAVKLTDMRVVPIHKIKENFNQDDEITVEIDFTVKEETAIQLNLFLVKPDGRYLAGVNTTTQLKDYTPKVGKHTVTCTIAAGQLIEGDYRVNVSMYTYCEWPSSETPTLIDILDSSYGVRVPRISIVEPSEYQNGEFNMQTTWSDGTS